MTEVDGVHTNIHYLLTGGTADAEHTGSFGVLIFKSLFGLTVILSQKTASLLILNETTVILYWVFCGPAPQQAKKKKKKMLSGKKLVLAQALLQCSLVSTGKPLCLCAHHKKHQRAEQSCCDFLPELDCSHCFIALKIDFQACIGLPLFFIID